MTQATTEQAESMSREFVETFGRIRDELGKLMVGQDEIVEHVLIAIACGGHVLLEGLPGLGKTALVTTIAQALDLNYRRVQFTPDLLPADIVGANIIIEHEGRKVFDFQPGPVFTNLLLADEINRATPKTQSALLETMQEKCVTVAGHTHRLILPFFVLATQNPIESEGTYPLPHAQLDRFFFKLNVGLPDHAAFSTILDRTCGLELPKIEAVASGEQVLAMGSTLRQVPIEAGIQDYLIHLVRRTHPVNEESPEPVRKYIRHGASPRAAQTLLAAARARALLHGRFHVSRDDIAEVARPALRHRLIMSFEAEAEGISSDQVISDVLDSLRD